MCLENPKNVTLSPAGTPAGESLLAISPECGIISAAYKKGAMFAMEKTYNILAADDDPAILQILCTVLRQAGYRVFTAVDGETAAHLAKTEPIDLIIMDVMMPKRNGILATVDIRQESNVPILMLSAKAEGSDRVLGLEAGADDYLVKPFYQQELLARVRALLRRYHSLGAAQTIPPQNLLQVGDLILDLDKKQLLVRGDAVRLTPKEFQILKLMMAHPGRVFPAEEIYHLAWSADSTYAVENTVMVHISRIRDKLEINPKKPEYLKVIWGIGYVLEAP